MRSCSDSEGCDQDPRVQRLIGRSRASRHSNLMSKMDKNALRSYGPRMNVALTPEFEALIRRKLATGLYKNASEVVREGLRLLAEEDEWKAEVRRKVAAGMKQARAGQVVEGEKAVAEVLRALRTQRGKTKRG